jgi:hypothetical protein
MIDENKMPKDRKRKVRVAPYRLSKIIEESGERDRERISIAASSNGILKNYILKTMKAHHAIQHPTFKYRRSLAVHV